MVLDLSSGSWFQYSGRMPCHFGLLLGDVFHPESSTLYFSTIAPSQFVLQVGAHVLEIAFKLTVRLLNLPNESVVFEVQVETLVEFVFIDF